MPAPGGGSTPQLPKKKTPESANVDPVLDTEAVVVETDADDVVTDALPLTSSERADIFQARNRPANSGIYSFLPEEDRKALGGIPTPVDLASYQDRPVSFRDGVAQGPTPSDPFALAMDAQRTGRKVIDPETGEVVAYAPGPRYQPIPSDPVFQQLQANRMMMNLTSQGISPFDTNQILSNLRALVNTPIASHLITPDIPGLIASDAELLQEIGVDTESLVSQEEQSRTAAKWILDNQDFVTDWQASYYNHVVTAPLQRLEGTEEVPGSDTDMVTTMSADLFKAHDQNLDADLRKFIINLGAYLPDYRRVAKEKGVEVHTSEDMNWWSISGQIAATAGWIYSAVGLLGGEAVDPRDAAANFRTGFDVGSKAGETQATFVQDPYAQILSEMNLWLTENPPQTVTEKGKFVEHFSMRAQAVIDQFVAESSGVDAVLNTVVGTPFRVSSNALNEWVFRSADPDSFISKENLSWGQNIAYLSGMDPSNSAFTVWSGLNDGLLNLSPVDPINVVAGIGNGIRLANQVPRIVTKAEAFREAARFGKMRSLTNMPVWNHGPISRFTYAAFSRTYDQVLDGRGFQRLARELAKIDNEAEIINRVPSWAQADRVVWHLANTADTPEMVTELIRGSIQAPELMAREAPNLANFTADTLRAKVDNYVNKQREWLAEGNSLSSLGDADEILLAARPRVVVEARGPVIDEVTGERLDALTLDPDAQADALRKGQGFLDNQELYEEVGESTIALRDGREAKVTYGYARDMGFDERVTVVSVDGQVVSARVGEIAGTADDFQKQGLYESILRFQRDNMNLTVDEFLQGDGALGGVAARTITKVFNEGESIHKISKITGDGVDKIAVTAVGGQPSLLEIDRMDLANYLDEVGLAEDAARVAMGESLADLSDRGRRLTTDYVQYAKGSKFGVLGDDLVVTEAGKAHVLQGRDEMGPHTATARHVLAKDYEELTRARIGYSDLRTKMPRDMWAVADITTPLNEWTKGLRRSLSTNSTKAWARQARRRGHTMTHAHPGNIDMTSKLEGGRMLRNWMKFLGSNDELANKWETAFREANVGNRQVVILGAFQEVGEQIGDPFLREGLLHFTEGQGYQTFSYGRTGGELGLMVDGRIKPVTVTHLQTTFAMPDYRTVAETIRRYKMGKRMPKWYTRGFVDKVIPESLFKRLPKSVQDSLGTNRTRSALKNRLAANARRSGVRIGKDGLTEDDLWAMAYADVLGGAHGRAAGHGIMAKAMRQTGRAYQGFHNVFTVAQLAGRPISWTSRVLIEENMRASMFGLPSLFANPYDWGRQMWEAHEIRRLPELLQAQARNVDVITTEVFRHSGDTLVQELNTAIPGFTGMLDEAGIAITDRNKVRAFFADMLANELTGVVDETAGARSNVAWRTARRRDRISSIYQNMARDGMNREFRWEIDGADIAQRSVFQSFMTEAEAAAHPMDWMLGSMSSRQQQVFGHGYGRQLFQMYHDPIVGSYGIKRWAAKVAGEETSWNAEKLTRSRDWAKIRHIVDDLLVDKQIVGLDDVGKAEWYLNNIVDEINLTLWGPLMSTYDDPASFLQALRSGELNMTVNGTKRTVNLSSGNYQNVVDAMGEFAQDAYAANMQLPRKIAAYLDPRYGQKNLRGISARARAATDSVMERFGERPTQYLHRQPSFKYIHGKWYRYLKDMGWEDEIAQKWATQKSAQLTNFIYFDNKNIPGFLKTLNNYIPFFSAMFEVGSTWLYKIPSVDTLPAGYLHMSRRVDRTIKGLRATGLLREDQETGQMYLNFTDRGDFARDPVSAALSRGMTRLMSFPGRIMENLMFWEDQKEWDKDGFSIAIGNPLDPSSTGLMAVNQFSAGFTPAIAWPAGIAAEAAFKLDDEKFVTEGQTAEQFIADHPDVDFEEVYRANQQAFNDKNPQELIARALNGDFPLEDMQMPDYVVVPGTSLWETMVDRVFFPFGKYEGALNTAYSVVPSSLAHVVRGGLLKLGMEDDEIAEMFIGSTAQVAITGEVLNQLQMQEFKTGALSDIARKIEAADRLLESAGLEARTNSDGSKSILNPEDNESAANTIGRLWQQIEEETERVIVQANNNAAGSMLVRGITGWLSPSTPRMWDRQQQQIANYWAARDIAKEAKESGTIDWTKLPTQLSLNDMVNSRALVASFLDDPSGRDAKAWMRANYPGMDMYLQGKSYWAGSGMPTYVSSFEDWIEQVEAGDREAFPPEVFIMRFWRSGIYMDREVAIRQAFGDDPLAAASAILNNPEDYYAVVDDFDARIESLEFIDQYMFDGAYEAWRSEDLSDLSVLEVLLERQYVAQDAIKDLEATLRRSGLDPRQQRTLLAQLNSAQAEETAILREIRDLQGDPAEFITKRDLLLNQYREEVSSRYYEAIDSVTAPLDDAYSRGDEQVVWENLRNLENEWYLGRYYITDPDTGVSLEVPPPMVRSWNSKSQGERQQRLLYMIESNPEWLSQFDMETLSQYTPQAQAYLPVQPEVQQQYAEVTRMKNKRLAEWSRDRDKPKSQLDAELREMDDEMDQWLIDNGYALQVEYKDATPFQRLDMLRMLPRSMQGAIPVYRQVMAELEAIDKSPLSNAGEEAMAKFTRWLEDEYFRKNPTAKGDLQSVSFAMYGVKTPTVMYRRLFQGSQYGELLPVSSE